jgi:H+-translocating NAD(P) transhydrogenase subunit alpha
LLNLPSMMAPEASRLYSRNVTNFLQVITKDSGLKIDLSDDLVRGPLVMREGEVLHEATRRALTGN